jgi:hypothetical protein
MKSQVHNTDASIYYENTKEIVTESVPNKSQGIIFVGENTIISGLENIVSPSIDSNIESSIKQIYKSPQKEHKRVFTSTKPKEQKKIKLKTSSCTINTTSSRENFVNLKNKYQNCCVGADHHNSKSITTRNLRIIYTKILEKESKASDRINNILLKSNTFSFSIRPPPNQLHI